MKNRLDNNPLLWKYLETIASSFDGAIIHSSSIRFRCPICGDGKTKLKKRGNIIWDKNRNLIYYKCFNEGDCECAGDGNAWGGARFLNHINPILYKQYITESLGVVVGKEEVNLSSLVSKKVSAPEKTEDGEIDVIKDFVLIEKGVGEIFAKAIKFCVDRKIPKSCWSKFYVATGGEYKNRLVIPFYSSDGSIYYYQARTLVNSIPKYLNKKTGRRESIYNIYNIDAKKPVVVLEGPIDSMFIENSISVMGLTTTKSPLMDGLNIYWLYDNDTAGGRASVELLRKGEYVFLWQKFLKDQCINFAKDINDVILITGKKEKFCFDDLKKYFSNSYGDIAYFI